MSRLRQQHDRLAELWQLRRMVAQRAQAQAQAAQRTLREAETRLNAEAARLDRRVTTWERALASASFDPAAVSGWGAAVMRQTDRLQECRDAAHEREQQHAAACQAYDRASAEERLTETLLARARRQVARRREERHLAEREDDSTRRVLMR